MIRQSIYRDEQGQLLFQELQRLSSLLAECRGVELFINFHNQTLDRIVYYKLTTYQALEKIYGMGPNPKFWMTTSRL
jgi:hypothetical protein